MPQILGNLTISGDLTVIGNTTGISGVSGGSGIGPAGPAGPAGPSGATGVSGAPGIQGPIGLTGPQGLSGQTGISGSPGAQGIQGIAGSPGPAGSSGDVNDLSGLFTGHTGDGTLHFLESSISHSAIGDLGNDDHPHYILADGTRPLTADWDVGNFRVNASGAIIGDPGTEGPGIGVNGGNYESVLKVSDLSGDNIAQFIMHRHSTTQGPYIVGARSHTDDASHSNVLSGDILLGWHAVGTAGSNYKRGAEMAFVVDGTASAGAIPTKFVLQLSEAITPQTILTIYPNKLAEFEGQISSTETTASPFVVVSNALVTGLNTDLLDSQEGSHYLDSTNFSGTNWTDLTDGGDSTLHTHNSTYYIKAETDTISGDIVTYLSTVSGDITTFLGTVSGDIISYLNTVSGDIDSKLTTQYYEKVVSDDKYLNVSGTPPRTLIGRHTLSTGVIETLTTTQAQQVLGIQGAIPHHVAYSKPRIAVKQRIGRWLAGNVGESNLSSHHSGEHLYPFGLITAYDINRYPHRNHARLSSQVIDQFSNYNGYEEGLFLPANFLNKGDAIKFVYEGQIENTYDADMFVEFCIEPNPVARGMTGYSGVNRMRLLSDELGFTWIGALPFKMDTLFRMGDGPRGNHYIVDYKMAIGNNWSKEESLFISGGHAFRDVDTFLSTRFRVDHIDHLDIYTGTHQAVGMKLEINQYREGPG